MNLHNYDNSKNANCQGWNDSREIRPKHGQLVFTVSRLGIMGYEVYYAGWHRNWEEDWGSDYIRYWAPVPSLANLKDVNIPKYALYLEREEQKSNV